MSKGKKSKPVRTLEYASRGSARVGLLERGGTVVLAAVAVFLFTFFFYAGPKGVEAAYRLLTDGSLVVAWAAAMAGAGVWLVRVFRLDEKAGFATCAGLGIGFVSLVLLGLGLLGALNRITAVAMIVGGLMAGVGHVWRRREMNSAALAERLVGRVEWTSWLWVLVMPFLAIAVLGAFMPPPALWGPTEPNGYDVVEYHLQVPREWYEAGRITPLHHNVFSFFPFNVEMHYLLAMHLRGGPWAGMYLAQLMHVVMMALVVVAILEFGGGRGGLGALLAAVTPWVMMLGPMAYNEGGMMLFGVLAIGWTLRSGFGFHPSPRPSPARGEGEDEDKRRPPPWPSPGVPGEGIRVGGAALAGVFAGLACGVKLTAAPMVLVGVPVALLVVMLIRGRWGLVRQIAVFVVCGAVVFSPWLIRNYVWARNPVFPEGMSVLGRGHFSAEQVARWEAAHSVPVGQRALSARVRAAWEQIVADWRFGFFLIPVGVMAIVLGWRVRENRFLGVLLGMWLVFWLIFTHLQGRFYVMAIPVIGLMVMYLGTVGRRVILGMVVLQVTVGFLMMDTAVNNQVVRFIGWLGEDAPPSPLIEETAQLQKGSGNLCLIGDAKAFMYAMPMSRLHYRTVFDVDVRGRSAEEAWLEGCPRKPGDYIFIDYEELRRFAKTYVGIPMPVNESASTVLRVVK